MNTLTTAIQRFDRMNKAARLAIWGVLGLGLLAVGFLVDGSTEIGHHACLILGGVTIGAGAMRETK